MLRPLLLMLALGCSNSLPAPAPDMARDLAVARDLTTGGGCQKDGDCRTFSNFCEGCFCNALLVSDPDPPCNGMMVSCLLDPCDGKVVHCNGGVCVTE